MAEVRKLGVEDLLWGSGTYTSPAGASITRIPYPFSGVGTLATDGAAVIDVRSYGTVGDGATSDFSAIRSALRAAIASTAYGHREVYIPPGDYLIDEDGLFSDLDAASKSGIKIKGAGWHSTRLILLPSGSDLWFYNNGATATMQFAVFQDIGFFGGTTNDYSTISTYSNGFKITSAGHEQGFKFINCLFTNLDIAFQLDGTNTASEMLFSGCKFTQIKSAVYRINNAQSVNHTFLATDIETIYGDIFQITSVGGAGAIKAYGGSWILDDESGADTYVYKMVDATSASGFNTMPVLFSGVKFELRGNTTKFLYAPNIDHGSLMVSVRDCTFWSTSTAIKSDWVTIGAYKIVLFDKCAFTHSNIAYYEQFHVTGSYSSLGGPGRIEFINCMLPFDVSMATTIDGYGRVSAVRCWGSVGAPTGEPERFAQDFDLGGMNGGRRDANVALKTAVIQASSDIFPTDNTTQESTVKLPANSIIKGFQIKRIGTGAVTTSYRLYVGNDDQTTSYADSGAGLRAMDDHTISVDNLFVDVGTTDNERIVRMWAVTGGTVGAYYGYATVQYW